MNSTKPKKDEWQIIDGRQMMKNFVTLSRVSQFMKRRVPQVLVIWAVVAVLLRTSLFISAFNELGRSFTSPFLVVGNIGTDQPIDITAVFLIGSAAILVDTIFIIVLYVCIKLSRCFGRGRPIKMEQWAVRFSGKISDEVSSILTHCSAATLVLLIGKWPAIHGTQVFPWLVATAAFMFVFGAICYREN
ncbi:hypothetical protein DIE15_15280 [Burkholderia sp. Bp9031]|uniref:hypothetical protein n=1 Tax=Burkholderia TaxID=32008 RepID=UPI000847A79C|nr:MULTISPECIES: hypothetical protein [Burkholderia]RQZ15555.1 hypothetical protein DIE15_15280 [Burkholderia sp. Bp9031]